uniref:Lipocalin n=1 Tax=Rhipicephalus zambeziensis TaxID=60191 RepID=A0A224YCG7_9ACAR
MLLFILPCLVDLASAGGSQPEPPYGFGNATWEDLLSALGTKDEIWLTKSGYSWNLLKCMYWLKDGISDNEYTFRFRYRIDKQRKEIPEVATLQKGSKGPIMKIRYRSERESQATAFTLTYWSNDEKCFILTKNDGSCEQHVWKPHIGKTKFCDKAFDVCAKYRYHVYSDTCINPKSLCIGLKSDCIH